MLPYVVQTHPAMESIAAGNITSSVRTSHFPVFLPLVLVPVRRASTERRTVNTDTKLEPLISGYLFVTMDLQDDAWKLITMLRGVKRILGENALSPTPIAQAVFDDFKNRFDCGEFNARLPRETIEARADDRVTVEKGAFANRSGVCLLTRKQRAKILLPMLNGGTVETWIALDNLRVDTRPHQVA